MDPLISPKEDPMEQTLGGKTYRIDTSNVVAKIAQENPLWKTAIKTSVVIVASPIIIPTAFLYTVSMFIGPSWWRNRVAASILSKVMKHVGELFDDERNELLKGIGPNDTLLDLGAGLGYYLTYLSKGRHLVAIEPCALMHHDYKKRVLEAGMKESQLELYSCDIESYIQQYPDKKASFDWIILGNVLCEVDDQWSTLQCINQLLKPGGYVYFSEHCGAPQGTWARRFQNLINPWLRTVASGCHCNRDSLVNIRNTKGWQVISWSYFGFKVMMGPFVLGLAMKDPVTEKVR